jgi:hypothetical protein
MREETRILYMQRKRCKMKIIPQSNNAIIIEPDKIGDSVIRVFQFGKDWCIDMIPREQVEDGAISNRTVMAGTVYLTLKNGIMCVKETGK